MIQILAMISALILFACSSVLGLVLILMWKGEYDVNDDQTRVEPGQ